MKNAKSIEASIVPLGKTSNDIAENKANVATRAIDILNI